MAPTAAEEPAPDERELLMIFDRWAVTDGAKLRAVTVKCYRGMLRRLAARGFSRVCDLKRDRLAAYVDARIENGTSASRINHELVVLLAMVRFLHKREREADQRELVADLKDLRVPLGPDKPINFFSKGEFSKLRTLAAEIAPWFPLALEIAVWTGCRRAELRRLDREDFDCERRLLRVRHKVGLGEAGLTKTGRERSIPMNRELVEAIRSRAPSSGPIFPRLSAQARGPYMSDDMFKWAIAELRERSGLRCTWHRFRRTFCTWALSEGMPITDVSRYLGHTEIALTFRRYAGFVERYAPEIERLALGIPPAAQASRTPPLPPQELAQLLEHAARVENAQPLLEAAKLLLCGSEGEPRASGRREAL